MTTFIGAAVRSRRLIARLLIAGAMALGGGLISAQDYPSKTVRIITAEIGGGNDLAARLIALGLTASLGKPVIVDNRGGSVIVAAEAVSRAAPDGHTLLLYGSNLWILPFMREHLPYDPVKDFAP